MPPEPGQKNGEWYSVSAVPDVCLTRVGSVPVPVPYMLTGWLIESRETSQKTFIRDDQAFTRSSAVMVCVGDEPCEHGVLSLVKGGVAYAIECTPKVLVEGSPVVHEGARMAMNARAHGEAMNTWGVLVHLDVRQGFQGATPTATPTAIATSTPSPTTAPTAGTPAATPTSAPTSTSTPTPTPTPTSTPTATSTATSTPSATTQATVTPTPSAPSTVTATSTPTSTATATSTVTPTTAPTAGAPGTPRSPTVTPTPDPTKPLDPGTMGPREPGWGEWIEQEAGDFWGWFKDTVVPDSAGVSATVDVVQPWTSGGGGEIGLNLQWTRTDGLVVYLLLPTNEDSAGLSIGTSVQGNVAWGDGSWAGVFPTWMASIVCVGGSVFMTDDWIGISAGWSGSPIPLPVQGGYVAPNYVPILKLE